MEFDVACQKPHFPGLYSSCYAFFPTLSFSHYQCHLAGCFLASTMSPLVSMFCSLFPLAWNVSFYHLTNLSLNNLDLSFTTSFSKFLCVCFFWFLILSMNTYLYYSATYSHKNYLSSSYHVVDVMQIIGDRDGANKVLILKELIV